MSRREDERWDDRSGSSWTMATKRDSLISSRRQGTSWSSHSILVSPTLSQFQRFLTSQHLSVTSCGCTIAVFQAIWKQHTSLHRSTTLWMKRNHLSSNSVDQFAKGESFVPDVYGWSLNTL